ncbi:MAG: DUF6468 domain-containing protein [Brevundimonas sp.]|uniref:DUF6468 domain-containing protein n=1 Tax=Brevundimonas sp. TaxID=1871086 RepID=UPI00271F440A|nr:DUF6468 domain-containing protein [Brevundimonas sp.]MDO9587530.1 DUF6468 domain-containing protein [Brevundimonas sp.]MDP2763923.1 DUF6468 domain-containing protein [Brevundimonas sp.]MDP3370928.1 DUF6468 domain-containing protein [Brevundimonas sp.]MDP3655844.1 DUF6468 domain-containing protein [Brevundimonas sp.]MDZ4112348.1 DUF6468 domain-containing protein [Brevundimonas sp.]
MTGMILDGVLMLLLVAALGYGVRLEKKLSALRAGQQAFSSAVADLNAAAGRAEAALASLRASGQETDLLHDRIVKAREVKAQLDALIARGGALALPSFHGEERPASVGPGGEMPNSIPTPSGPIPSAASRLPSVPVKGRENDNERAQRMAVLAERIQGMAPAARAPAPVAAILGALTASRTANQAAKQSLNQSRRNLDEDLFAA